MPNFRYELVEYAIADQNLTLDDIKFLLTANWVSPFSLVRRVFEIDALPLLSHPDFLEDFINSKSKVCSENCRKFIKQIQEIRKNKKTESSGAQDPFTAQLEDRRNPLPAVLISFQNISFMGALMSREGHTLNVVMPTMSLKVGQSLELLVLGSQRHDRLYGKVKTFVERLDRRNTSRTFYVYEITYFV